MTSIPSVTSPVAAFAASTETAGFAPVAAFAFFDPLLRRAAGRGEKRGESDGPEGEPPVHRFLPFSPIAFLSVEMPSRTISRTRRTPSRPRLCGGSAQLHFHRHVDRPDDRPHRVVQVHPPELAVPDPFPEDFENRLLEPAVVRVEVDERRALRGP